MMERDSDDGRGIVMMERDSDDGRGIVTMGEG